MGLPGKTALICNESYGTCFFIIVANASPILAAYAMRGRLDFPLDGGLLLFDGQPIFGESKTVRGIVAAIGLTAIVAVMAGHPAICGILIGAYAMLGDLTSSFLKRRMRLPSSSRAPVLDHIPEAFYPAMLLAPGLGLATSEIIAVAATFLLIAVFLSPVLYNARLRKQPY